MHVRPPLRTTSSTARGRVERSLRAPQCLAFASRKRLCQVSSHLLLVAGFTSGVAANALHLLCQAVLIGRTTRTGATAALRLLYVVVRTAERRETGRRWKNQQDSLVASRRIEAQKIGLQLWTLLQNSGVFYSLKPELVGFCM